MRWQSENHKVHRNRNSNLVNRLLNRLHLRACLESLSQVSSRLLQDYASQLS